MTEKYDGRGSSFKNLGGTCYLNSALNSLFACKDFVNYFTSGQWKKETQGQVRRNKKNKNMPLSDVNKIIVDEYIINVMCQIITVYFSKPISNIDLSSKVDRICKFFNDPCSEINEKGKRINTGKFRIDSQQDSNELITTLLLKLHNETRSKYKFTYDFTQPETLLFNESVERYYTAFESGYYSEIYKIFGFQTIESYMNGTNVLANNFNIENNCVLSFSPTDVPTTIYDLFDFNFNNQFVPDDTKLNDVVVQTGTTKTLRFWTVPKVLIIQLLRFIDRSRKNETNITVPLILNVAKYKHESYPQDKLDYHLVSIVYHTGTLDFGHYIAYVKHSESWFVHDDSVITPIETQSVKYFENNDSFTPYVLFYIRI
jgi:ubiquitin C-terminal hydrolase